MSREPPKAGVYLSIYLSVPLLEHIEREARLEDQGIPGWIRDRIIDLCPPHIQAAARAAIQPRPKGRKGDKENSKPAPPPPPPPKLSLEELVEKHREKILELDAKGYLPNSIGAVLRVPYRVVSEVLYRRVPPKKGMPK